MSGATVADEAFAFVPPPGTDTWAKSWLMEMRPATIVKSGRIKRIKPTALKNRVIPAVLLCFQPNGRRMSRADGIHTYRKSWGLPKSHFNSSFWKAVHR